MNKNRKELIKAIIEASSKPEYYECPICKTVIEGVNPFIDHKEECIKKKKKK